MIAKRIQRDKATSNFARLGRYVVDAQGGINPATWTTTAEYILDTRSGGAKVGGVRITNCSTDDAADAVAEIMVTQSGNKLSKADKSYHLVFSFPAGERPALATLHAIEDHLVASIGLADHQRLSAVHIDTDNLHVHVAINKVHPLTFSNIEPYFDKRRLMAACVEMEQRFGLQTTAHGEAAERSVAGKAGDMESHAGRDSLLGWIQREVMPALPAASDWQGLHRALAGSGLTIKPAGAGLVVSSQDGTTVKASQLGRGFSRGALEKRFGPFEPAGAAAKRVQSRTSYRQAPRQTHQSTAGLFATYQAARTAAQLGRATAQRKLLADHGQYKKDLDAWYGRRRTALKSSPLRGLARRIESAALTSEKATAVRQRKALAKTHLAASALQHALPTWQQWLAQQADNGNEGALAAMRSRDSRRLGVTGEWLRAPDEVSARNILLTAAKRSIDKLGAVTYAVHDGGRIRDEKAGVRVQSRSDAATFLALSLAAQRYAGQALIVNGSAAFKAHVASVAAQRGLAVQFADPSLEALRTKGRQPVAAPEERGSTGGEVSNGIETFVAERNRQRELTGTIVHHVAFKPADAGSFAYRGRRQLPTGGEAVLLQRGETMYVMRVTAAQAAKASTLRVGQSVETDARGRFVGLQKGRGR